MPVLLSLYMHGVTRLKNKRADSALTIYAHLIWEQWTFKSTRELRWNTRYKYPDFWESISLALSAASAAENWTQGSRIDLPMQGSTTKTQHTTTELQQPGSPSQSSKCTAQVVLNVSVAHPAATYSVCASELGYGSTRLCQERTHAE